jgi:hypothetical protein
VFDPRAEDPRAERQRFSQMRPRSNSSAVSS